MYVLVLGISRWIGHQNNTLKALGAQAVEDHVSNRVKNHLNVLRVKIRATEYGVDLLHQFLRFATALLLSQVARLPVSLLHLPFFAVNPETGAFQFVERRFWPVAAEIGPSVAESLNFAKLE